MRVIKWVFNRNNIKKLKERLHPWGLAIHSDEFREVRYHPNRYCDEENILCDQEVMERGKREFASVGYFTIATDKKRETIFPGIPAVAMKGERVQGSDVLTLKRYIRFMAKKGLGEGGFIPTVQKTLGALLYFIINAETNLAKRKMMKMNKLTFIEDIPEEEYEKERGHCGIELKNPPLTKPVDTSEVFYRKRKGYEDVEPKVQVIPGEEWKLNRASWVYVLPECYLELRCPFCQKQFPIYWNHTTTSMKNQKMVVEEISTLTCVKKYVEHLLKEHKYDVRIATSHEERSPAEIGYAILRDLKKEIFRHLYYPHKIEKEFGKHDDKEPTYRKIREKLQEEEWKKSLNEKVLSAIEKARKEM